MTEIGTPTARRRSQPRLPLLPLSECVVLPAKLVREWATGGRMRREQRDDRAWVGRGHERCSANRRADGRATGVRTTNGVTYYMDRFKDAVNIP